METMQNRSTTYSHRGDPSWHQETQLRRVLFLPATGTKHPFYRFFLPSRTSRTRRLGQGGSRSAEFGRVCREEPFRGEGISPNWLRNESSVKTYMLKVLATATLP